MDMSGPANTMSRYLAFLGDPSNLTGISRSSLQISEIHVSCAEAKKLRVVVSVKLGSTRDEATWLGETRSEDKTQDLSLRIHPSSAVNNGKLLVVQVYKQRRRWCSKELLNEEFPFDTLRAYCTGESESKVYEILRKDNITIGADLKATTPERRFGGGQRVDAEHHSATEPPDTSIALSTESEAETTAPPSQPSAPTKSNAVNVAGSSWVSNLSAALTLVQQVGDLVGSVPLMNPIAEILTQFVEVYKVSSLSPQKVEDNCEKRDRLVEKVAVLAYNIADAMLQLEAKHNVGWRARLQSDLEQYMEYLQEAREVTITFDNRRGTTRLLKRDELGDEFDLLDEKLDSFETRFRAIDLRIELGKLGENLTDIGKDVRDMRDEA
ncbi:hypothetical protein B0H13DRAFT_1879292 [Mycena leptocephala]|nr:hypothetical protein B0H13DRAFT_1879292 [Mycena leptocephala]